MRIRACKEESKRSPCKKWRGTVREGNLLRPVCIDKQPKRVWRFCHTIFTAYNFSLGYIIPIPNISYEQINHIFRLWRVFKNILHLNEFLNGHYYATFLINASKVWSLYFVHTNISINERKKNVSMYKTVHVERYVRK